MEEFYQIVSTGIVDGKTQVTVRMNAEHPIYQAHFPGHPVTPGAMLVSVVAEVVAAQKGIVEDVSELKNVKFLQPHNPQDQAELLLTFDASLNPVDVVISAGSTVYAKMEICY